MPHKHKQYSSLRHFSSLQTSSHAAAAFLNDTSSPTASHSQLSASPLFPSLEYTVVLVCRRSHQAADITAPPRRSPRLRSHQLKFWHNRKS
ncbi:hypothetical protein CMV_022515 [Castanea mollissima]|uniref:Uncharacterized protein n=1 Tax=Castanea mollissima TaxID=60419 RepID=A0A8J4QUT5_9ROSI|nr:hypothetical protein CMV_022515 [Castanea mollissima]